MSEIVDLSIYTHSQLADMNMRQREMVKQAWDDRDKAEDSLRENKKVIDELRAENAMLTRQHEGQRANLARLQRENNALRGQSEPMTMWHTRKIRDLTYEVAALQNRNDNQAKIIDSNRLATAEKTLSCGCVIRATVVPAEGTAPVTEGDKIKLALNGAKCNGLCGEFMFKNVTVKVSPYVPKGVFFMINGNDL